MKTVEKTLITAAIVLLPFVSYAAPLTNAQATSLIQVVQSSTSTPASAFTDLITAFSNITVQQAESLIAVVQAAPGVAPDAFVNMLIAFTQDAPVATDTKSGQTDTTTQPTETTQPVYGSTQPVDQSAIVVTPNGVGAVDPVNSLPYGSYSFMVQVRASDGSFVHGAPVTATFPDDAVYPHNQNLTPVEDAQSNPNTHKLTNSVSSASANDWSTGFTYVPSTPGAKTLTFTSGGLTKTVSLTVQ